MKHANSLSFGEGRGEAVTRFIWDGNVPLHEWQYNGAYPPNRSVTENGIEEEKEPVENIVTWVYEDGSFVPCAKLIEEKQYSIVTKYGSGLLQLKGTEIKYALVDISMPKFEIDNTPDFVLVQKKAFSCNYRDIGIILQNNDKLTKSNSWAAIGSEFSGIVIAKGKNVKTLSMGDRVIPNGEYPTKRSNYQLNGLPTNQASLEFEIFHHKKLVKIPEDISFEVGAGFTIGAQTTYSMIRKLKVRRNQKGLILGFPSNTSMFALNALMGLGINLYIGLRNSENIRRIGFPEKNIFVIPESVKNFMDIDKIYEDVSIFGKFDFVIDPFSDANLFRLIDIMKMNGKYVTCGISNQYSTEKTEIELSSFIGKLILNNISIMGNCLGNNECISDAISDCQKGNFSVPIGKIIKNDIREFMNCTFVNKQEKGKIIFKYD